MISTSNNNAREKDLAINNRIIKQWKQIPMQDLSFIPQMEANKQGKIQAQLDCLEGLS